MGMIDLDSLIQTGETETEGSFEELLSDYGKENSLYINLALALCDSRISYIDFMRVSRWLGCYHYVLPSQRTCIAELSDLLYARNRYNLFGLALLVSHLAANLTEEMQMILLEKLQTRERK